MPPWWFDCAVVVRGSRSVLQASAAAPVKRARIIVSVLGLLWGRKIAKAS